MAKKQLVELVNRLKKSGIKVSFTKPRTQAILSLHASKTLPTASN
ncbi:hypothetical protein [Bacillus mesophilum]|jgi:hypothetical protein|nr:hypothetical protein [Bacillus mesophilum]